MIVNQSYLSQIRAITYNLAFNITTTTTDNEIWLVKALSRWLASFASFDNHELAIYFSQNCPAIHSSN